MSEQLDIWSSKQCWENSKGLTMQRNKTHDNNSQSWAEGKTYLFWEDLDLNLKAA